MSRTVAIVEPSPWVRLVAPAAAVVAHLTAIPNGFTWLDHGDLERGKAISGALFTRGFAETGFYRPLTAASLWVDSLVGRVWMFHVTAVLLHALAAFGLVLAAEAMGMKRRVAVLGATLFAVHWVTSLVVAQASFRAELLVAAALFLLIWAVLRGHVVVAGLMMLAAGLSKETGLVLGPLFSLAVIFCATQPRSSREKSRDEPPPTPGTELRGGLPLLYTSLGGWLVAFALRLAFAPPWRPTQPNLSALEHLGTRLASLTRTLSQALIPTGVCDALPVVPPWSPLALVGLALAIALTVLAWKHRGPALLLGLALLPALNLVAAPRFWSPHSAYLPWAFAALLLAGLIGKHLRVACVIAAGITLFQNQRFATDETLFATDAQRPECREANLYLGDFRFAAGDLTAAAIAYQRAAAPPPPKVLAYSDERAALQNLGLVRMQQQDWFEAELAFTEALSKTTDRAELTHNLAAVALARGDPASAVKLLEPLVKAPDARPESLDLLARARAVMQNGAPQP